MTRLLSTFAALKAKNEAALVTFITAGDPSVESTPSTVALLAGAGADVVELGIPYSDPLADGPSIQAASQRALDKGVTPATCLHIVHQARKLTDVPLVLMTSYNVFLRYGLERFAAAARDAGADGAILTDLPPEEAAHWKRAADAQGLSTVFLVTPLSSAERIAAIAAQATGFVYCVSRTGVTGTQTSVPADVSAMLGRVRQATDKPACVGFGISTPEHVAQVAAVADGAVIGSALVDFLHQNADNPDRDAELRDLVSSWKDATRRER